MNNTLLRPVPPTTMNDHIPEKLANPYTILGLTTRRLWLLIVLTFTAMLIMMSIDQSTINNFIQLRNQSYFMPPPTQDSQSLNHPSRNTEPLNHPPMDSVSESLNHRKDSESVIHPNHIIIIPPSNPPNSTRSPHSPPKWLTTELPQNYTSNLISRWIQPGGKPCLDSRTTNIKIPQFDNLNHTITLTTTDHHDVIFQAVDSNGNPHCIGGDFFEINLSSDSWKSRPPLTDLGNGNYSFTLQVHHDFPGEYNLTITFLFGHFEGLKFSPTRFAVDKQLRQLPITFIRSTTSLPPLPACRGSDFNRTLWTGRWTRHAWNDECNISDDGRYRCQPAAFPCPENWCNGPLGLLESNGWVYSAHCGFKLFTEKETWDCLSGKWLLWWGDSNHVDTVRNILFFFLGIPEVEVVTRRFDKTFKNPRNVSQTVRMTNIFNGHWDHKGNYEGLNSLSNHEYREMIRGYFNGERVPDVVVFNSGLHDGVKWVSVRRFAAAAKMAAGFWAEAMRPAREGTGGCGKRTQFVFRSTVATGGYARTLGFNPNKMEVFNGMLLEKLLEKGIVDVVVDDFDMTWAWHFDNRCNDGVHYGRFPAKMEWRDGQIGHQYFVDLMLAHVLLNAICLKS